MGMLFQREGREGLEVNPRSRSFNFNFSHISVGSIYNAHIRQYVSKEKKRQIIL